MLLSQLTNADRALGVFGLAKNTGKTLALKTLLRELETLDVTVGVTSIGRDGESVDAVDHRISKPAIHLAGGSLLATTEGLMLRSGLAHTVLERTGFRTPVGPVAIYRTEESGNVEIAGPSSAAGIRTVAHAMSRLGAERVVVDGAINRKAAASPSYTDAIVLATGAVLNSEMDGAVEETRNAVEVLQLPAIPEESVRQHFQSCPTSALVTDDGHLIPFGRLATLQNGTELISLLGKHPSVRYVLVRGVLCDHLLEQILQTRPALPLTVAVIDSAKIFLTNHTCAWYRHHGIHLNVLHPTQLRAITVNPVAPLCYRFDSQTFVARLQGVLPAIPVLDVMQLPQESHV